MKIKVLIAKRGKSNLGFVCHTYTVDISNKWTYSPLELTEEHDAYKQIKKIYIKHSK